MSNANDFVIENGVLTKYVGTGGDVVIPDGVTEIGDRAFVKVITSLSGKQMITENNMLKTVKISNSVTTIGTQAFYGCEKLSKITLSENLKSIGAAAFSRCFALTEIILPNSVTEIKREQYAAG